MVKTEPNSMRGYLVTLFWLCYCLSGLTYAFSAPSPYENLYVRLFGPAIIGILNVGSGIAQLRFWYKQNCWRQQAAAGNSQFVAEQQPSSNSSHTLVLPTTIIQRTAKGWTVTLVIGTILFLAFVVFYLYVLFHGIPSVDDVPILFILVMALFGFALFIAAPILRGYQTLTVDEQGIRVRVGFGRVHTMRWNEAKLFAISSSYKFGYNNRLSVQQLPTYYELSNARDVVRWRWVHWRSFIAIEPTLPVAEYDEQMRAVLSLVSAKTGLTLCDVRTAMQIRQDRLLGDRR